MSCSPTNTRTLPAHRKRTSSFSFPSPSSTVARPHKAQRTLSASDTSTPMGSLRRTASQLSFPTLQPDTYTSPPDTLPYQRTLRYYKEQRERRKSLLIARHKEPATITISTQPVHALLSDRPIRIRLSHAPSGPSPAPSSLPLSLPPSPPPVASPSPSLPASGPHTGLRRPTSPLAPVRTQRPPRTTFPKSKGEPDLYRKAITGHMRCSPEGQKILVMGARLAVSILTATRELERIVARNNLDFEREDVMMDRRSPPPALTNSWVIVPGEDWEMVDCSA